MTLRPPPEDRSVDQLLRFGVLALDKPAGPSAHQVTAWVREHCGLERAAHAGTLDPRVTGCLPTLLGDATRLAQALLTAKEYVAVLECHAEPPSDFETVLRDFEGPIYQTPPKRSAVVRERRIRTVESITCLEREERLALLRIRCESGTYVRKLCHDIGLALGTGANMGDLRRSVAEPFDDTELSTLQELVDTLAFYREDGDEERIREVIQPAERALDHLPAVTIATNAASEVAEGAPVYAPGVLDVDGLERSLGPAGEDPPLVACYTPGGTAVCLGRFVGDPAADSGTVVDLERVLVS